MDINGLTKLFDVVDNYIDASELEHNTLIMPVNNFNYLITTPYVFNHLRKQAYYSFASLLTVEVLTKLNEYIIYTTKHLKDKYKRTSYRTKLIKKLKQL